MMNVDGKTSIIHVVVKLYVNVFEQSQNDTTVQDICLVVFMHMQVVGMPMLLMSHEVGDERKVTGRGVEFPNE